MGMVVKNNIPAQLALGEVQKNDSTLTKSLKKVSSGMRINGASDDASGYSISERMRVQIRGLTQATSNTQNGRSMLRIAEGAVDNTVEILKTLKEKALDAANDTNTDIDRATIQKQINESVRQIDDNARVDYNGKRMLDGSMSLPSTVEQTIVKALNSEWIDNCLDLIDESFGLNFHTDNASVKYMSVMLEYSGQNGTLAYVRSQTSSSTGKAYSLELHVNMDYYGNMDKDDVNGLSNVSGAGYLDRTLAHEMTHAVMRANIQYMSSMPLYYREGSAEVVHGIDDERGQRILNLATSGAGALSSIFSSGGNSGDPDVYAAGYMLLRYMEKQGGEGAVKKFIQALSQEGSTATGLDISVRRATGGKFQDNQSLYTSFLNDLSSSGGGTAFLENYCGIKLSNDDTGAITGQDAGGEYEKTAKSVVPEAGSTLYWHFPNALTTTINGLEVEWPYPCQFQPRTVAFHTGTKANEAIKLGFSDMRAEALGLRSSEGLTISVLTRKKATDSLKIIDKALDIALDQQTTLGALDSRLDYTEANIVAANENVQGSESVIRDADMAREMMEYTKANVILQASQSMLAQANQNASSVLSLLQ